MSRNLTQQELRTELDTFVQGSLRQALSELRTQLQVDIQKELHGLCSRNLATPSVALSPARGPVGPPQEFEAQQGHSSPKAPQQHDWLTRHFFHANKSKHRQPNNHRNVTNSPKRGYAPLLPASVPARTASIESSSENQPKPQDVQLTHEISLQETTDGYNDASQSGTNSRLRDFLESVVTSLYFEHTVGLLVIANSLTLGVETDLRSTNKSGKTHFLVAACEPFFCILFTIELLTRIFVYRSYFFIMQDWLWNLFDILVVSLQLIDQAFTILRGMKVPMDVDLVRIVRVCRLIRITRLIRVVRLVEALRTLVSSIYASMKDLFWTLLLLVILIYMFSVAITEVVQDVVESNQDRVSDAEHLEYWFGNLSRTILTMFESIVGGVSWDEVAQLLIINVSPIMGGIFCLYIGFCIFAMLNVVTGVFVDKAMTVARENGNASLANHISDLFFDHRNANFSEGITWEEFTEKINSPNMKDYFKELNLNTSEGRGLFDLLDVDGNGSVDPEEIVNGCLRLRGPARALELSLLMRETTRMHKVTHSLLEQIHQNTSWLCKGLKPVILEGYGTPDIMRQVSSPVPM